MARRLRAVIACALVLMVAGTLRYVASAQAPNKELAPFKGTVGVQASDNAPFTRVFGRTVVPDDAYAVTQAASLGTLTLPDSSQVAIGERTAVRVGAFNNAAAGPGSTLTLNHGALRFAIVHPAGTRSNYTFQTQTSQIAVRGTTGYLIVGDEGTQLICVDCAPGDVTITIGTRVVTLLTGYTITIIGPPGLATFTITANDTSYNPSIAQFLLLLSHPDFAGTGAGSDPTGYYVTGGTQTGLAGWVVPVVVGGAIAGAVIANNNVAATPTPSPTPTAAGSGTPSPTPTPTQVPYSQLMVSTNTLTFTTVGGPAQTFTVQQTGPGGSITIGSPNCDDNGAAAMDSPLSVPITPTSTAATISVTAQAAPTSSPPPAVACTILITGGNGQTATVNVDITSTSIGVHGLRPTSPPAPPTSGPPTPPPPPSGRPPH